MANTTHKQILAIDQGTTGTRALVMDETGAEIASAYKKHRQIYPKVGWVEHDPKEIWSQTKQVIQKVLKERLDPDRRNRPGQPGRNGHGLATIHGRTPLQRHRLARPPNPLYNGGLGSKP